MKRVFHSSLCGKGDWRVSRRWVADDVLLESQPEAAYSWPPKHLRHHTSNDLDNTNIIKEGHLDDTAAHSQHKRKRKNHGRRNKHHKKHSPEHDHLTLLEGEEGKQLLQQHSHQSRLDTRKQRSQKHHKHLNEVLEATLTPTYPLKSHNSFFGLEENSSSLEDGVGDGEGFLSGVDDRRSERVITDRGAVVHDDVLALHSAPVFDKSLPAKVQAQLGAHAYLPCRIIHMGDKSVSWVRNADSHILTVDSYTFISDERFTARFDVSSQTWTLQIKFVTDHDAGAYECQVSTEPKISRSIQLSIVSELINNSCC
ncbi:hypothetical protein HAZT_HAZT005979 [Hyalella azteca]|uniref:Ig-like domain-containing protein n=1 Tax=Hyalella azteca TaxID=294128 RepID=A0A6A0H3F6_HYAAZ|nr:hypothetical protein HAZT_HAZT005979 [Hyalella azteca]